MTGSTGLGRFVRPQSVQVRSAPAAVPDVPAETPQPSLPGPVPEAIADALRLAASDPASPQPAEAAEKCEMCAAEVPAEHGHVADLEAASLMCACRACYLLFTQRSAGRGRYRAIPDRYLTDPGRVMSAAEWDQLEIPVGLAFFLRGSRAEGELTGFYPSPAGATECRLDLQRWQQLAAAYPLLGLPEPDVEAALISRGDAGVEYFVVPIDACYELAGRMRLHWRGFDGGTEARQSIAEFLTMVRSRARAVSPDSTAVSPDSTAVSPEA